MSIYDYRDRSAYEPLPGNPDYCENKHILSWWTDSHDHLLSKEIQEKQWSWYWCITDEIVSITSPEVIIAWRNADPLCSRYAWYNVLMNFAVSRAKSQGLTKAIRRPEWKLCPLCNEAFVEDSLPFPLIQRLGIDRIDFCAPCLRDTVLQDSGNYNASRNDVCSYLRDLAGVLERVPTQNFGEGTHDLFYLNTQERLAVLQVLRKKPSLSQVRNLFGSWLNALIEAGVLEDGTRRTSRGTTCLARDGHTCRSLGEKTIDDLLFSLGIPHEKEITYPESKFITDFNVGGIFIEYFGLAGDPDYDAKIRQKEELCTDHGIKLIAIYSSDLLSSSKLKRKLLSGLIPLE